MLCVAPRMQTSMYVYACLSNKYIGPVWWSFCSGSCPRHVSLGAGNQPPPPPWSGFCCCGKGAGVVLPCMREPRKPTT